MSSIARNCETRLAELVAILKSRGLQFPESATVPGLVCIEEVARLLDTGTQSLGLSRGAPSRLRVLLNRQVEALGLMGLTEFKRNMGDVPSIAAPRQGHDETGSRLARWIDDIRVKGLSLPESALVPGQPHYSMIAREAGIEPDRLAHPKYKYRGLLDDLVSEVGLIKAFDFPCSNAKSKPAISAAQQNRIARVREYIHREYIVPNVPLPEATQLRGQPNYRAICYNSCTTFSGRKSEPHLIPIIDAAAAIVGIGADRFKPAYDLGNVSYDELMAMGIERYAIEEPFAARSTVDRFRGALRKWQDGLGRWGGRPIDDDFDESFANERDRIAADIKNSDTRRHWLAAIDRWRLYVSDLDSAPDDDLPPDFAGAIRALQRRGKYDSLRAMLGILGLGEHINTISGWIGGTRQPVRGDRTLLRRLETALKLEPGTLEGRLRVFFRVSTGDMRIDLWPNSLNTKALRKRAKPLLPDNFAYLSADEREEIGLAIRAEYETQIPYRQRIRSGKKWRMEALPEMVSAEWAEIVEYKTTIRPKLPRASKWRLTTADRNLNVITEFFNALALSRDEGGLGIPPEDLTFGLCACNEVLIWYAKWKIAKDGGKFTASARVWLGVLSHLSRPETMNRNRKGSGVPGFLQMKPEWAKKLKPIPGILTPQEVVTLNTVEGWAAGLSEFAASAAAIFVEEEPNFILGRDPFQPILPILDLEMPMNVLVDLLAAMFADLPDPRIVSPYRRAIAVRRFVSILFAVRTALRRRNINELTYLKSGQGQLRRDGNRWVIEIPAQEFKVPDGPFFGQKQVGRLNSGYSYKFEESESAIIEEYVSVSRNVLSKNGPACDFVFVTKTGKKMSADQITLDMHDVTWRYICYHKESGTGMRGVEPFGIHAIRDITATHILKNTGDVNLAADAIQDSPDTVLAHYARYLTSDRTKRVQDYFRESLTPFSCSVSS